MLKETTERVSWRPQKRHVKVGLEVDVKRQKQLQAASFVCVDVCFNGEGFPP